MTKKAVKLDKKNLPDNYPQKAAEFVSKCLIREPGKRLGNNGIDDLKEHAWFKDFDWEALRNKTLKAPFIPNLT